MVTIIEENDHSIDLGKFHSQLINWGVKNFRSFPWRETRNPYNILISEVMLHRTQASQVVPVYEKFIKKYPDIKALSVVIREELYSILYSLGLHWRTELIHQMVQDIMNRYSGRVPKTREDLLSLPGISEYIAGAVRCFAWEIPEPLADTNTVRVAGRLFGLEVKDSSRRNRRFKDLLSRLQSYDRPRDYTFALLDLADKVCTKRKEPDCKNCPIVFFCDYGLAQITD